MKTADELSLAGREADLYAMIWKRTVATQMVEAAHVPDGDDPVARCRVPRNGRHIEFPGYFRAYVEGVDDPDAAWTTRKTHCRPYRPIRGWPAATSTPSRTKPSPRPGLPKRRSSARWNPKGSDGPARTPALSAPSRTAGYVRKVGNQLVPTFTALAVTRLLEDIYAPRRRRLHRENGADARRHLQWRSRAAPLSHQFLCRLRRPGRASEIEGSFDRPAREACSLKLDALKPVIRVGRFGPYFEDQQAIKS